jgi:hypothetical protein
MRIRSYVHIRIRSYVYMYVDVYVYFCSCNNSVLFDSLEFLKIENQIKSAFSRVCLLFVFPKKLTYKFVQIFGENCSGIAGDFFRNKKCVYPLA